MLNIVPRVVDDGEEMRCCCGHALELHPRCCIADPAACAVDSCDCSGYRSSLTRALERREADAFYAELKASLDERAPA